ncbi:MAG: RluA family pseudouridine synthase [Limisphaerales bacterium]
MSRDAIVVIEQSLPMERLDTFLKTKFPAVSRGTLQRLMDEGHILVDGKKVKPNHTPRPGQTVSIHWPEPRPAEAQPQDIPLDVLFEDKDFLVINKPAGLVVHPAAGHETDTLVNALLHHCAGKLSGIGGVARPGIVHRLDKDTSGCLVVAKNDEAHLALAEQFAGRSLEKTYHALLCGDLPNDNGEIQAAIARHPTHRKRMTARDDGREAHTSYKVIERLAHVTYVETQIHTGRTHQIRVHFQHIGYPVVGDLVYGDRKNAKLSEVTGCKVTRQMLHASRIVLKHPRTKKQMKFEAPIPKDFNAALKCFRKG